MKKSELRKIYLAKQKNLSDEMRQEKSQQIAHLFFQTFNLSQVQYLHCFLPIARTNEINTNLIFRQIWQNFPHIETLVPRVNFQTNEIENLKFNEKTNLIQNEWQIYEPTNDESVENEKIDMVLVPLLCVDKHGFRVGYGKGFYDKFLNKCRKDCLKIGLSYFPPVEKIEDAQDFDVKLNFCITSDEVISLES